MKKTFPLNVPGKEAARVLELVRSDVGRYINREKRKAPPSENDQWEFVCRVGPDETTADIVDVKQVHSAIGQFAAAGAASVYVEVLASAKPRPKPAPTAEQSDV